MGDSSSTTEEMKYISWTPCSIGGKNFFVKYLFSERSYSMIISDLKYLYCEEMGESEILQRWESLNPGIEMPLERVIKRIKMSFEDFSKPGGPCNIRNMITIAKQSPECLEIKAESYVAEVMFVWFFTLNSMGPSSMSTYLLLPLIGMCAELKRRNQELIQVIKRKDEEIEDYKMNGAKVTRKRLETKPFMESNFVAEMDRSQCLLESLKESAETALTDKLYSAVVQAQESLKRKAEEKSEEYKRSKVVKEANVQQKSELNEVRNEDSGVENRTEEMQRRVLLEQELRMKTQKKRKKKALNL